DVNFPIPPLSGAVRYNGTQKLVVVEQITGRNGVGSLDVRGTVSLAAKDPEYRMRVRLDGVRLDKQLEDALPKHLRGVWDAVGILGGSVDTDLAVAGRGDQPPRVTGTVDAEAVSLRPEAFPYSLPPLSGRIRLAPGYAIHLDRLSGSRDGLTVEGSGFIDASTKNVIPQLRVRGQDLPVDEQLISALPEAARDPVKAVGIAGGNVDVDFVLDAIDGKAAVTTEVTLHGCSLKARDAPYALEGLRGTVRWSDRSSAIEIHDVAGRHGQAGVTVNGRVDFTHPDKPEIDITLDATDVALDDSLFQALPEDVRKQLAPFAFAGNVDIEARHVSSAKTNERTRLTVTLDGVDLNVTPKGPRLTDLAGAVQTDGRTLTLPFVRGRFATLPFETNGAIALQPTTTGATLRFRVPPTHLDASLVEHLPESFADIARRLGPRGMIALSGAVRSPEDSTDVHLSSATLSVSDVSLAVPPGIDALTGSATYVAGKDDEGKLAVKLGRVRIAGLSLRDLEASADLTQKGLDIHDMAWMFYDGRVTGKFRIGADKLTPWEGQIDISHVDVEDLAVALGATTQLPTGWLGGKIIFHGVGDDMSTVAVTGEGRLESGHLYNLPLIVSIWNLFSFANPGRGAVTDARLKFRLRDEVLHIDHFLLTGEAMPMAITGSIELKPGVAMGDQKMDIIITAARQKGLLDEIPVVSWIKAKSYNQLRKHILQARATGTFNNPKLSTVMDPLTKPISEFWSLLRRDTEEKKAKTTQDEDNIKMP
ncbi:hypothetical protein HQ560_09835, partial [bacterium]|nr:hypothetical protein [bacterium]